VKRSYWEGEEVRLRPENGDYEQLGLPAGAARVQGRLVYVVHVVYPPGGRCAEGGS